MADSWRTRELGQAQFFTHTVLNFFYKAPLKLDVATSVANQDNFVASEILWLKRPNMTPNVSLCLIDQLKSFRSHLRSFKLCGSVVFCGVSDTHCDTSLKMFRNTSKHIDKYSIFVFCLFVCLFWNAWIISTPYNCILTLIQARVQ